MWGYRFSVDNSAKSQAFAHGSDIRRDGGKAAGPDFDYVASTRIAWWRQFLKIREISTGKIVLDCVQLPTPPLLGLVVRSRASAWITARLFYI